MTDRVYLIEFDKVHNAPVVSCHATFEIAERAVLALLDTMPKRAGGSHGKWRMVKRRKRSGGNHGRHEATWTCNSYGPSTKQISAVTIFSMKIEGSAVDRLGALVSE